MTTTLLKKYSANLVKDCFRVGDNYYRAVEMIEASEKLGQTVYALHDIKNGGTQLLAVTMEIIMDFIGEDYELVSTVATYDTSLSQLAHYILPQTEDTWKNSWKQYFQEDTREWQKVIDNEAEHVKANDSFYVEQAKVEVCANKFVNNKIDEVFDELKRVKNAIFREDLEEKSFEEIMELLPDYTLSGYNDAIKRINDKEYFFIQPAIHEDNDGIEYAVDNGYKTYLKVSYHYVTELDSELSLNLEQRHHFFYVEMLY